MLLADITSDNYAAAAVSTECPYEVAFANLGDPKNRLFAAALSDLITHSIEVGESQDQLKKGIFYGKKQIALADADGEYVKHFSADAQKALMQRLAADTRVIRLLHAVIGLQTEASELQSVLAAYLFEGIAIDWANVSEESGDVCWYLGIIADILGTSMTQIMQQNIDKLRLRYPNKFNSFDALNRNLCHRTDLSRETTEWRCRFGDCLMLVVFEGIDGSGKGTQVELLTEALEKTSHVVVNTHMPGGTDLGTELRELMFHKIKTQNMAPFVVDSLFLADMLQTVNKVIEPGLAAGKVVIADRHTAFSQVAYSTTRPLCPEINMTIQKHQGPAPDVIFLLIGTPAHLLTRAQSRKGTEGTKQDGKAWNKVEQMQQIQDTYMQYLAKWPQTVYVPVDILTPGEIHEQFIMPAFLRAQNRFNALHKAAA
jgi:dTMP kinase